MQSIFSKKIQVELVKLLYKQIKFALWAEAFAAIGLAAALWGACNHALLLGWLVFNLAICFFAFRLLVLLFHQYAVRSNMEDNLLFWLVLFGLGAFLTGISWGAAGSILMLQNDVVRQMFTIILLVGVTAAANLFYSSNRYVYAVFLIPAFLPITIWLLLQGGIYVILSFLAFIYIILMLVISYYYNQVFSFSLKLRFENIDLVENLSNAKNSLTKQTQELEKSLSLVRATLDSTTDAILVVDSENRIEDFNQKFVEMWDIPFSHLKNRDIHIFFKFVADRLENPVKFEEKIHELYATPEAESFDDLVFKDGRAFECYSCPQKLGQKSVGRVWSFSDVTKHKSLEDKLFRQANFDILTGLPNRSLLVDRTTEAIALAKLTKSKIAILFLDLDRFKLINDTLGHPSADKLLLEVSNRLIDCVNENDVVCREGGDEYIVILKSIKNEREVLEIAHKILNSIRETYFIDGHKFNITISIGISFYPKDGEDPESLIRCADIAMYQAKELGRNNFQFFTEDMNKKILDRLIMEGELREALDQNQFVLVYQPIVSLKTGYIVGLEVLLRWQKPNFSSIPTSEFISVAEESGIIVPIGDWVLHTACLKAKNLQKTFPHLQIAVNLSGRQFKQANFLDRIRQILQETQFDPRYLAIELTERTIMDEREKTMSVLTNLKKMGATLVIDDFGTGYSSLNYLKQLPVDKVKIDRTFIKDIPTDAEDRAIIAAIIALAGKLNLKVVAEGVEKESQLKFLIEHHCDEMQGFYFSAPLVEEDCIKVLTQNVKSPFLGLKKS